MSKLPIQEIFQKLEAINNELVNTTKTEDLIRLSKEQKKVQAQADLAQRILNSEKALAENKELIETLDRSDEEMLSLLNQDIEEKTQQLAKTEEELLSLLAPTDPKDSQDILLEIRAGAGGDESALFAADLLRMYSYLAQRLGFKLKIISMSENTLGGYKEVIAEVRGEDAYAWFKYEGGVHRVQRVPATEKQGRIHTSTVSVAIMPLIEDNNDFKLDPKDIEIILTTSSGNGGQSVNTTYSAVRMKHTPTGIEAQSQDERNQIQNRQKALQVLTSRVFDFYEQERLAKESAQRKEQVGRADRSEKIRTYNFPQDRITDHRFNLNWNQLPAILDGEIIKIVQEIKKIQAQQLLSTLDLDKNND